MYGNTDEAGNVSVDFIYEPPQEGSPETLKLHRGGEEEAMVGVLTMYTQACRTQIQGACVVFGKARMPGGVEYFSGLR